MAANKGKGRSVYFQSLLSFAGLSPILLSSGRLSLYSYCLPCYIVTFILSEPGQVGLYHVIYVLQPKGHSMISAKYFILKLFESFVGVTLFLLLLSSLHLF